MLQWKIFSSKWSALSWLVFISILFVLPGSAIPHENWFSKVYLDKWVHVTLFSILVFLWRSAFQLPWRGYNLMLLLLAAGYGIGVEYVQEAWVPNRSFDVYDILADITGSVAGLMIWALGKKNKPL